MKERKAGYRNPAIPQASEEREDIRNSEKILLFWHSIHPAALLVYNLFEHRVKTKVGLDGNLDLRVVEMVDMFDREVHHSQGFVSLVHRASALFDVESTPTGVQISTIHSFKGKEVDHAFVVGAEDRFLEANVGSAYALLHDHEHDEGCMHFVGPWKSEPRCPAHACATFWQRRNAEMATAENECRHLAFVAITRARNNLYLTGSPHKYGGPGLITELCKLADKGDIAKLDSVRRSDRET